MYYGQFNVDQVLEYRFFANKRNGFFIECGAFDGVLESTCKFFEDTLGWTGINIEPVPYLYNKLVVNRPKCRNLNVALSDDNCTKEFTQAIHPVHGYDFGNGSLTHSKYHMDLLLGERCIFEKFNVECVKFCDLNIIDNIDLFVLDIEGHELQALPSIVSVPSLPKIMCVEFTIVGLDNISNILGDKYKLHSTHENNAFYVLGD